MHRSTAIEDKLSHLLLASTLLLAVSVTCGPLSSPDPSSTPTPVPSPTPAPTATAEPTPTPPPTPTPLVRPGESLSSDNIAQLEQLAQIGRGELLNGTWSPDGGRFALGTGAGIYLFDGTTLEEQAFLPSVYGLNLAYSPDGAMIATGAYDDITLWDPNTGELILTISQDQAVDALTFIDEGRTLLVAGLQNISTTGLPYHQVTISHYDTTTGNLVKTATFSTPSGEIVSPEFVDDGQVALLTATDTFYWINTSTGGLLHQHAMSQPMMSYARSRASLAGIINRMIPNTIELWDLQQDAPAGTISPGGAIVNYEFSTDGQSLTVFTTNQVSTWDLTTQEQIEAYSLSAVDSGGMLLSPDGTRLINVVEHTVRLIDVMEDSLLNEQGDFLNRARHVAISPDHRTLAMGRGSRWERNTRIEVWDTAALEMLNTTNLSSDQDIGHLAFSPDGQSVVANEAEATSITFWSPSLDEVIDEFETQNLIFSFAFDGQGQVMIVGSDKNAGIWDLETGESIGSIGPFSYSVRPVSISADGRLAAASSSGVAIFWDVAAGREVLFLDNAVHAIVSPDGSQFVYANGSVIEVMDAADQTSLFSMDMGGEPVKLAYTPGGDLLIASCEDDTMYFWDATTGELLNHLKYRGRDFDVSADGQLLVTASSDGTVRLWGIGE